MILKMLSKTPSGMSDYLENMSKIVLRSSRSQMCAPTKQNSCSLVSYDIARRFSQCQCYLSKPGKPSGINKSKSMFKFTAKFLDGGMEEPKLVYNIFTGNNSKKSSRACISSGLSPRRLQVLNKLFFENIKEIMQSCIVADHLIGHNFHVTKVRVVGHFSCIHVFWMQTGNAPEPSPELLKHVARLVRTELHHVQVTSRIPPIIFHRDSELDNVLEVERRLTIIAQELQPNGHLEPVNHLSLPAPPVPDEIFEPDFKFDASAPLSFAASTTVQSNPKNRPRSSFTPFAPRGSYSREKPGKHERDWQRPVQPAWQRSATAPRQVALPTACFNLNRAAVMARVERGLARVKDFKSDGIDINVYEANLRTLSLDQRLLGGSSDERYEAVLPFMPRSSLAAWAGDYTRRRVRGDRLLKDEAGAGAVEITAGVPTQLMLRQNDYDEDEKFYEFECELHRRTDEPDCDEDICS
ncbi:uncharacterized protein LOC108670932 [Hyalella azteca]|uniref:Uncharacterized protein LOC108670932 n=1 Tax=Hyalella azteca TaxID=294128 RepID=A0A8B7NJT2_HYAAZ|nr:uncharacterized protein LOC108670932 [Hyalella azteca]